MCWVSRLCQYRCSSGSCYGSWSVSPGQVQAGQQLPPDVFVLFALVGDGATGMEGDRVPLVQQVLQVVPVPS